VAAMRGLTCPYSLLYFVDSEDDSEKRSLGRVYQLPIDALTDVIATCESILHDRSPLSADKLVEFKDEDEIIYLSMFVLDWPYDQEEEAVEEEKACANVSHVYTFPKSMGREDIREQLEWEIKMYEIPREKVRQPFPKSFYADSLFP
jgi:hypothetical protein